MLRLSLIKKNYSEKFSNISNHFLEWII